MRTFITIFVLTLATASFAFNGPNNYSFGYSSDDYFSGGSSYLGVDTRDVTPDRLSDLGLKEEHGVEVTMVDQDAPAGKAGVKEHDVILNVNGTAIESVEQLRRVIHEIPSGRVVALGISRKGQQMTLKTQLADRSKEFAYSPKNYHFTVPEIPHIEIPPMHIEPMPNPMPNAMVDMDYPVSVVVVHSWMRSGLMVENLTPQLSEFFGAKSGQGVLVRSVEKGSRAEKAGFRAGDIIIKANGEPINDAGDFSRALRSRKDNTTSVTVIRDKKEQTLTLTLPPRQTGQILNESLEIPEINEGTQAALAEARVEMENSRSRMQEAMRVQGEELKKQLADFKSKTLDSEKFREQMREMKRQLRDLEIKIRADI